ncbi:hypothetical protein QZH41_018788, partial [Actinostola sp. cb2023]
KRRLFCKNGHYLEINYNGTVNGTMNEHSPLVVMEIIPASKGLVRIRGAHTGFYLAVAEGEVYTTKTSNDECLFQEKLSNTFFDNYWSNKHLAKKLMLGIMRTGTAVAISENSTLTKNNTKYETNFVTKMATT